MTAGARSPDAPAGAPSDALADALVDDALAGALAGAPSDVPAGTPANPLRNATRTPRPYDSGQAIADILAVATEEFAAKGLAGARIDEIAERTRTSKRMIYYYFGSKEGLYLRVLEAAYGRARATEAQLDLEHLPPEAALRRLTGYTFDQHAANPEFVRLVMNENIHRAEYLRRSETIRNLNRPVIASLRRICERGCDAGTFRDDLDPVDLHMTISALAFHYVANRHTFALIFDRDMASPQAQAARRATVEELVARFVRRDHPPA